MLDVQPINQRYLSYSLLAQSFTNGIKQSVIPLVIGGLILSSPLGPYLTEGRIFILENIFRLNISVICNLGSINPTFFDGAFMGSLSSGLYGLGLQYINFRSLDHYSAESIAEWTKLSFEGMGRWTCCCVCMLVKQYFNPQV